MSNRYEPRPTGSKTSGAGSMRASAFSVEPIVFPTGLVKIGEPHELGNLGGCENSIVSQRALDAVRAVTPELLLDHWDSQDPVLRGRLGELHGVSPDQVLLTSGAYGAVLYTYDVFVRAETHVGLLRPDWPGFRFPAEKARSSIRWLTSLDYPFSFSLDQVIDFCRREALEILMFSNPSATTGRRFTNDEIEALIKACPETLIVVDEGDSITTDSCACLTGRYANTLAIRSFSKFYGLSGLRIGYLVIPPQYERYFKAMINPCELTGLALVAATAALGDIEYQEATQRRVRESLALVEQASAGTPYRVVPGSQCFATYLWPEPDVEDLPVAFARHGLRLAPASIFGLDRGGRINLSNPNEARKLAAVMTTLFPSSPHASALAHAGY